MLVLFRVKNVLSFKEEAVLDMRAVPSYKEHLENLIDTGRKEKYLRVAAIYGANAGGKSNFWHAIAYFQKIVMESKNNAKEEETILSKYFAPFALDDSAEDSKTSEFEIFLQIGENEYQYGFRYNDKEIKEEWLYRKGQAGKPAMIFVRDGREITFGSTVKGESSKYEKHIPRETLVLSFFGRMDFETNSYKEPFEQIQKIGYLVSNFDSYGNQPKKLEAMLLFQIDENKNILLDFLKAIDTGIKDIRYELFKDWVSFSTAHKDKNGNLHWLSLSAESEGTLKSIFLFLLFSQVIRNNEIVVVDELNNKLHPLLQRLIINMFYQKGTEAQLIFTTHNTNLMDKRFFRRDQIWFVQKDEYGHSELFALSDFKVRNDASFEKDYLAGVYDGIPILKDISLQESEKERTDEVENDCEK